MLRLLPSRLPCMALVASLAGCGTGAPRPRIVGPEPVVPVTTSPEAAAAEPAGTGDGPADSPAPDESVPWPAIEAFLLEEYPAGLGEQHGLDADLADLDGDGDPEILVEYVAEGTLEGYVFRRRGAGVENVHRGSQLGLVDLPGRPGRPGLVDSYTCCGYDSISVWILDPGEPAMTEVFRLGYGPAEGGGTECDEGDDVVYVDDVVELEFVDAEDRHTRRAPGAVRPGLQLDAIHVETGCPGARRWTTHRLEDLLRETP